MITAGNGGTIFYCLTGLKGLETQTVIRGCGQSECFVCVRKRILLMCHRPTFMLFCTQIKRSVRT